MQPAARPTFYFGVMSPYSWFAAERIGRLLEQARWRCVLAGVVFREHDRTSWGLTERRAQGIADCESRACEHGLGPIVWPQDWPTSDLRASRAFAYCQAREAATPAGGDGQRDSRGLAQRFALAAMRLAFLEGADLERLDSVLEAGRRCDIAEDELRNALAEQRVKDRVRAVTAEAIAAGVFGVPTVRVGDALFWGDDRLQEAVNAYRAESRI